MKIILWTSLLIAGTTCFAQTDFLKPEGLAAAHGYTHAVVAQGKMVFLSGQVAMNRAGVLVGKGDLRAQTTQVFENLKAALASAGATFDDVVRITWYVKGYNTDDLPILREVRDKYVNTAKPPASTLVGVASLFQPDYMLEVDAIAVVPEKHQGK